jgi:uncharacterized membrane protein
MSWIIALHLATVLPAFAIGTWLIFFSEKGARRHRALGAAYLVLMFATSIVTLFIREVNDGRLSWVHFALIPLTLFGIFASMAGLHAHNIRRHRNAMIGLYVGIVAAGAASLLPGRSLSWLIWG